VSEAVAIDPANGGDRRLTRTLYHLPPDDRKAAALLFVGHYCDVVLRDSPAEAIQVHVEAFAENIEGTRPKLLVTALPNLHDLQRYISIPLSDIKYISTRL